MTMRKGVFLFTVGVLAFIRSAPTTLETVWLKDVTTRLQTDKRTFGDLDLPTELTFHISRGSDTLTLNLKRNHDINPNADIYFVRKLKDGQSVLVKTRNLENEDVAYYQDRENGAYMTVRCVKKSNEQCDRAIKGHIRIGDSSYDLRPAETDVTSRNLLEDPGLLGKRYVLQDHALIQRENSVESKDAAHVNEKEVEQDLKAVLRRFEGQHKQNHHNRGATSDISYSERNNIITYINDKSRQVKAIYYVKIAVLIDSGLWDLYSSTVHTLIPLTKSRQVKRKIRELYSHVMNGVSLLYEGIEDTSISINIILSHFIFFKHPGLFQHVHSEVKIVDGKKLIDALPYLKDVGNWDALFSWKHQPPFDHAMLFTRCPDGLNVGLVLDAFAHMLPIRQAGTNESPKISHELTLVYRKMGFKLYENDVNETGIRGLSFIGTVCTIGKRISVIERGDYNWMEQAAAHELGHSLGAYHDGDDRAGGCRNEDSFIMSSIHNMTHSRNHWLFSNCSVEAFKNKLRDKKCVKRIGPFFNLENYRKYIKKQPGQVYSINEQCRHIYGGGSVCCETVSADYCHAMRCTDPKTRICQQIYLSAARGTECGRNMDQAAACLSQPCMKSEKAQDFHAG